MDPAIVPSNLLTHPKYERRTCGAAQDLIVALRAALADRSLLPRFCRRALAQIPTPDAAVIVGPALGPPFHVESRGNGDALLAHSSSAAAVVIWFLHDPLAIDTKQTTFCKAGSGASQDLFDSLYRLSLADESACQTPSADEWAKRLGLPAPHGASLTAAEVRRAAHRRLRDRRLSAADRADVEQSRDALLALVTKWADPMASPTLVGDRLFVGPAGAARDRATLSRLGVTHVVSLAAECGPQFPDDPNLSYHHVPLVELECGPEDLAAAIPACVAFILNALNGGAGGGDDSGASRGGGRHLFLSEHRVLVHCVQGKTRSAATAACALAVRHGRGLREVLCGMREVRDVLVPDDWLDVLEPTVAALLSSTPGMAGVAGGLLVAEGKQDFERDSAEEAVVGAEGCPDRRPGDEEDEARRVAAASEGIMLGIMCGDALGAGVEGWPPGEIRRLSKTMFGSPLLQDYFPSVHMGTYVAGAEPATYEPAIAADASDRFVPTGPPQSRAVAVACARCGCYTDDTNTCLALASSLVDRQGLDAAHVARRYGEYWLGGDRPRGYPPSAKAVMRHVMDGKVPLDKCGLPPCFPFPGGSFANGGAMRISPLAIAFRNASVPDTIAACRAATISSHVHPEGVDGTVAQCLAVQWALRWQQRQRRRQDHMEAVHQGGDDRPLAAARGAATTAGIEEHARGTKAAPAVVAHGTARDGDWDEVGGGSMPSGSEDTCSPSRRGSSSGGGSKDNDAAVGICMVSHVLSHMHTDGMRARLTKLAARLRILRNAVSPYARDGTVCRGLVLVGGESAEGAVREAGPEAGASAVTDGAVAASIDVDEETLRAVIDGDPGQRRPGSGFGFQVAAIDAIPCVLWVVAKYWRTPRQALMHAVALGGDTDTIASMVGAILGALHGGRGWLPVAWIEGLENGSRGRDFALSVAAKLARLDLRSI